MLSFKCEKQKRVSNVGEKEREFVLKCYSECGHNSWQDILKCRKEKILEGQLPLHVVQLYLEAQEPRLITRLKNIAKATLKELAPQTSSKQIEVDFTRYAQKKTPNERRKAATTTAIAKKLNEEFVCSDTDPSSSDSDAEGCSSSTTSRKRKADFAVEAHKAHKTMCKKAVETMSKVNDMLTKVDKLLDKKSS